ncbi:MAG: DUF1475 family protein [Phycisphaerales bacterium]|nr:DUF1475 family protein [Phycisphaerales bacterium]
MTTPRFDTGGLTLAIAFALSILGLLVLFVVSSLEMSLGAGLRAVASTLWGVTTLADLYIGLLFIAVWIWFVERCRWPALVWTVALVFTGNFATAVYVLQRAIRKKTLAATLLPNDR